MKKVLAFLLLLLLLVGYCAVPLTSVSSITIAVEDEKGGKITENAAASFLDSDGRAILDVALGELPSWDNNIHWWAHSSHETSKLRPEDARRARSVLISAQNCGITQTANRAPERVRPAVANASRRRASLHVVRVHRLCAAELQRRRMNWRLYCRRASRLPSSS